MATGTPPNEMPVQAPPSFRLPGRGYGTSRRAWAPTSSTARPQGRRPTSGLGSPTVSPWSQAAAFADLGSR